jgi:hypothetical protein
MSLWYRDSSNDRPSVRYVPPSVSPQLPAASARRRHLLAAHQEQQEPSYHASGYYSSYHHDADKVAARRLSGAEASFDAMLDDPDFDENQLQWEDGHYMPHKPRRLHQTAYREPNYNAGDPWHAVAKVRTHHNASVNLVLSTITLVYNREKLLCPVLCSLPSATCPLLPALCSLLSALTSALCYRGCYTDAVSCSQAYASSWIEPHLETYLLESPSLHFALPEHVLQSNFGSGLGHLQSITQHIGSTHSTQHRNRGATQLGSHHTAS